MRKPKISMVSYINAKPFQLGLEMTGLIDEVELHLDVPSVSAQKLIDNKVDIALVPVATLPKLKHPNIITDYCIGSVNEVASVGIFSDVPVSKIQQLYLDDQSRTSSSLARILFNEFWKSDVEYLTAFPGYEKEIKANIGGLIIGDRAIKNRNSYNHFYDLGKVWKEFTNLPFVYATWVSNNEIDIAFETKLNEAFRVGLSNKSKLVQFYQNQYGKYLNLTEYFEENISFDLDKSKYKALDLYLAKLKNLNKSVKA